MYLSPLLRPWVYSTAISSVRHVRSSKPSLRIGKDRFELTLDVRNFDKDEITVKAHPKYVTIEGKRERKTSQGRLISQFIKRYRLPEGIQIKKMESRMSPEGFLTVTAPRACGGPDVCNTIVIPIATGEPPKKKDVVLPPPPEPPKVYSDPCAVYLKVKPKPPDK